ncbi:MAG: LacI family DNA-binding transcriptional regulator [Kangiellaceae bacterium]
MKATINDVAKHAGVSIKTVSRVINNEPAVRKSTFDKVQASVKTLNYRPNNSARSLAGHRSYTVAYVYNNPNAYYVIDMQNGILAGCQEDNFELLIHPCNHNEVDLKSEFTRLVDHSRIAGVVLTPPFSEMADISKMLDNLGLPYVKIMSGSKPKKKDKSSIYIDDHRAAYSITEHLIELGHIDIGFICGGFEHQSSVERLNGYYAALNDYGIKAKKRLVIDGEYSFDSGVQGANKLLARNKRPSAIFASNDEMAAGALFAASLQGIKIPQELSVVGFEDSPYSRQTSPQLTTAHQPNQLIAKQAVKLLIAKIQERSNEFILDNHLLSSFQPQLVIRGSSGAI